MVNDEEKTADKRGEAIDKWMEENSMVPLNSGERTHASRREGHREMAPDITIVNGEEADKYSWEVINKLGGSDHFPIVVTRDIECLSRVNTKSKFK